VTSTPYWRDQPGNVFFSIFLSSQKSDVSDFLFVTRSFVFLSNSLAIVGNALFPHALPRFPAQSLFSRISLKRNEEKTPQNLVASRVHSTEQTLARIRPLSCSSLDTIQRSRQRLSPLAANSTLQSNCGPSEKRTAPTALSLNRRFLLGSFLSVRTRTGSRRSPAPGDPRHERASCLQSSPTPAAWLESRFSYTRGLAGDSARVGVVGGSRASWMGALLWRCSSRLRSFD
jgi:hypothetical protein